MRSKCALVRLPFISAARWMLVSKLLNGHSLGSKIHEDQQRASARACKAYLISIYIGTLYL